MGCVQQHPDLDEGCQDKIRPPVSVQVGDRSGSRSDIRHVRSLKGSIAITQKQFRFPSSHYRKIQLAVSVEVTRENLLG
jgi:hypothetical protein